MIQNDSEEKGTNLVLLNVDLWLKQSFLHACHRSQNITDFLFYIIITGNFNLAITDDRQYGFHRWQDVFAVFVQFRIKP